MRKPRGSQRGSALVEFSWLAIMILVPTGWLVLAVFDVQRATFALTTGVRSAGRAYVLAPNDQAGLAAAQRALAVSVASHQGGASPPRLNVRCRPNPAQCHAATSVVVVTARSSVSLPWLPASWGLGNPTFALSASHAVPVGQYRASGGDHE